MLTNPMNVPPVSIAAAKAALIEQYAAPRLRRRATMLWGTRGVGKSSVVRQVAAHFGVPLVDLRLTTIEPVDLRGAIYADDVQARTVWFPPEFLPTAAQPEGVLFLDELTAADQRLQISAYSLILDRRVGNYALPDGWQIVAAGNASFHGAVSHDMGTALADRMFHLHVQTTIDAFLAHAVRHGFAPEVLAYLKVRPDKLDDTAVQLAADHLVGASPRGWEDVSNVLQAGLSDATRRVFVQGRIGSANAAEFFGVLRELRAGANVVALLAARPGAETAALLPRTLDALYALVYGLLGAICGPADSAGNAGNAGTSVDPGNPAGGAAGASRPGGGAHGTAGDGDRGRHRNGNGNGNGSALARALEIVEQLPDIRGAAHPLPIREVQTLAMELLAQHALERGLDAAVLGSAAYQRYAERRQRDAAGG